MDKKKESFLSDNIRIWMHNEAEAQKSTEESLQDIPKGQKGSKGELPLMLESFAIQMFED